MAFTQQFLFTQDIISLTPMEAGVYLLFQKGELIYIGRATGGLVNVRSRLLDHLRGDCGPCTKGATHFAYELRIDATTAEVVYLTEFKRQNGRLPRCNDRIG